MGKNKAIEEFKRTGSLTILTRSIRYDKDGKLVSDTITDHIKGVTYTTPKRKRK